MSVAVNESIAFIVEIRERWAFLRVQNHAAHADLVNESPALIDFARSLHL